MEYDITVGCLSPSPINEAGEETTSRPINGDRRVSHFFTGVVVSLYLCRESKTTFVFFTSNKTSDVALSIIYIYIVQAYKIDTFSS